MNNLHSHLGLPEKYPCRPDILFNLANKFSEVTFNSRNPVSKISLLYYFDKYGDPSKKNDVYSKLVSEIIKNLPPDDMLEVVSFLHGG